ncbi:lysosomal dipeptide transporter MFSD1-like [Antedon mediterranea]|uniref:lysosomal dipeptide transporter MFSD1-like n=1 Tax=Antedon mediterranea TaxID=105859 RepID=UPI003AF979D2
MPSATKGYYRFLILTFNSLALVGCYYCYDIPSTIQGILQAPLSCNESNITECTEGFGLNSVQYNQLYAISSFSCGVSVLIAGYLVDRCGNVVGLIMFSVFAVIGTLIFAISALFKGALLMFPGMLIGRLFFGSAYGSTSVIANRMTAFWFKDKEIALAFGFVISSWRAAGCLNFFLSKSFANDFGVIWTLWFGTLLVCISFLAAIVSSALEIHGKKQLPIIDYKLVTFRLLDVVKLSPLYWLTSASLALNFSIIYAFIADSSEFIRIKYNYAADSTAPSYYTGTVYLVATFLSPIIGMLIDQIGRRCLLGVFSSIGSILVFCMFAFTHFHPLIGTILLGIIVGITGTALWSCLPLVVPEAILGTAMGVSTCIVMLSISSCNMIVGEILQDQEQNEKRWKLVMIFLLGLSVVYLIINILTYIIDIKKGGVLNTTKKKTKKSRPSSETQDALFTNTENEGIPLIH